MIYMFMLTSMVNEKIYMMVYKIFLSRFLNYIFRRIETFPWSATFHIRKTTLTEKFLLSSSHCQWCLFPSAVETTLKGKNLLFKSKFFPLKEVPYVEGDRHFQRSVTSDGGVSKHYNFGDILP